MDEDQTSETPQRANYSDELKDKNVAIYLFIAAVIFLVVLIFLGFIFRNKDTVRNIINLGKTDFATPTPVSDNEVVSLTTLSGIVYLGDNAPSGSTIAIAVRESSESNFIPIVTDMKAINGVPWEWNSAKPGVIYDVQAYLVSNISTLFSQSTIQNVTAPVSGIELTIDVADLIEPPTTLVVDCVYKSEDDMWKVSYTYGLKNPPVPAKQYRLIAGADKSGNIVMDQTIEPTSSDAIQSSMTEYYFKNGMEYFGAYSYATCESCSEFSAISEWVAFTCNEDSVQNIEPTLSPTSTPTSQTEP